MPIPALPGVVRTTKYKTRTTKYGFTLVELLVALSVSSVILGAVAALAYAATSANDSSNEAARVNTQLRTATLRITELIRHCKMIAGTPGGDIVIWVDDNGDSTGIGANNDQINAAELVFMEVHSNKINLVTYTPQSWSTAWFQTTVFTVASIKSSWAEMLLSSYGIRKELVVLPSATNITCSLDTLPPYTQYFELSFDLEADGIQRTHQISAHLQGYSGHLINASGEITGDDD